MASAKPSAALTSATNVPPANADVTRAKKTVRRKTEVITLDSRQTVRRQSNQAALRSPDFLAPIGPPLSTLPSGSTAKTLQDDCLATRHRVSCRDSFDSFSLVIPHENS